MLLKLFHLIIREGTGDIVHSCFPSMKPSVQTKPHQKEKRKKKKKNRKGREEEKRLRNATKLTLRSQYYTNTKTGKEHEKKRKLLTIFSNKHRCKNSQ
jgi:hypothetical protein